VQPTSQGFNIFGTPSSKSGSFIENFFGN